MKNWIFGKSFLFYEKLDIWEIIPLIALIIGLEIYLGVYKVFEDEMLYPWEGQGKCPK